MKYTGLILGAIGTICLLFVTTYSVLVANFGTAIILAMMTIMMGGIVTIEYNEIKEGGDKWQL
jgi:hypothetical protein